MQSQPEGVSLRCLCCHITAGHSPHLQHQGFPQIFMRREGIQAFARECQVGQRMGRQKTQAVQQESVAEGMQVAQACAGR